MDVNEKKQEVSLKFWYYSVEFDNLEQMLRVFKTAKIDKTTLFKEYVCLSSREPLYIEAENSAKEMYDNIKPYTPLEVFQTIVNQEQKMVLLSLFTPEEISDDVNFELIDTQTIKKKQIKTLINGKEQVDKTNIEEILIDDVTLKEIEFDDTYQLFKISKDMLLTDQDVYVVKCNDTSTKRVYHIYVDPSVEGATTDAISAIASTMRTKDNKPLTKEQYIELIKSET
jgi:hypothetical protein